MARKHSVAFTDLSDNNFLPGLATTSPSRAEINSIFSALFKIEPTCLTLCILQEFRTKKIIKGSEANISPRAST